MKCVPDADEHLMREAQRIAAVGLAAGELPIGAIVTRGGEVVARARASGLLIAHAETHVLRHADELRLPLAQRRDQLPRIRGGVLRDETVKLFGEYIARHPGNGGLTAWARTMLPG